jgi:hypothetical protein
MNGQQLVYAVIAISVGVTIASASGGFVDTVDYDPSVNNDNSGVIDEVQNVDVNVDSQFSALSTALSLAGTIITIPFKLPQLMISFGVPEFIASAFSVVVGIIVAFMLLNLFLRSRIFIR